MEDILNHLHDILRYVFIRVMLRNMAISCPRVFEIIFWNLSKKKLLKLLLRTEYRKLIQLELLRCIWKILREQKFLISIKFVTKNCQILKNEKQSIN